MVSYQGSVESSWAPQKVFAYLSDFANTSEWDPATVSSDRLDGGKLGVGAQFKVVARFLGRSSELQYRIVEFQPPRTVILQGKNEKVTSTDTITVAPLGSGSLVSYSAELQFVGVPRLAEPFLALAFKRVGDNALAGLKAKLN